jgi:hypothetical protein
MPRRRGGPSAPSGADFHSSSDDADHEHGAPANIISAARLPPFVGFALMGARAMHFGDGLSRMRLLSTCGVAH